MDNTGNNEEDVLLDADGLRQLYKKRQEEYNESKDSKNRIDANIKVNVQQINQALTKANPHLLAKYGINTQLDPNSLTEEEVIEFYKKIQMASKDITKSLSIYLQTGKVDSLTEFSGVYDELAELSNNKTLSEKLEESTNNQSVGVTALPDVFNP